MQNFWPSSGFDQLKHTERNWLAPTDGYLRRFLERPELALVPESCAAEQRLHTALRAAPSRTVSETELQALLDPDARESYSLFVRFRNGLMQAGSLEAYYQGLLAQGNIAIPPLFIDLIAEAILRHILDDSTDAFEVRAAEMLFRSQRLSVQDGQVLAGDRDVLDMLNETGGLGDFGRFLAEAKAPLRSLDMHVLTDENAVDYWPASDKHNFLLDLTHEVSNDLSHGLVFTMTRARSGLKALSGVLEKWVLHFTGAAVRIRPLQKVDDDAWRWHVGLDVEASALLNDLYEGQDIEPSRLQRLVSLFRLDFENPQDMRPDVAGKPVYLGLMMTPSQTLKLKPQNLLLNLPLRSAVQ